MLRRIAAFTLLAIACQPSTAAPPPAEPDAAAPDVAAEPLAAEPVSAGPAKPGESEAEVDAPEADAPEADEPEADEPGAADEADDPETTVGNAVAALPTPIYKSVKESCGRDPGVGSKLKPFRLKNLEGEEVTEGRFRKRVMLVNFWGTWCAPCLKELPEFSRLYRRYRKAGMTLVAIATDEDPAPVKELVEKRKIRAKILLGGEEYAGKYGAPNFPFSYVVDTSGTIVGSYFGFKEDCMGKLEDDIRKALGET